MNECTLFTVITIFCFNSIPDITHNWDLPCLRFLEVKLAKPVTLTCDIEGRATPNYTWSSNSSDLTTIFNDTLILGFDTELGPVVEITCSATAEVFG